MATLTVLAGAALVLPDRILPAGTLQIEDGRISGRYPDVVDSWQVYDHADLTDPRGRPYRTRFSATSATATPWRCGGTLA